MHPKLVLPKVQMVIQICLFLQYEMYIIERNSERTASAGRLLYDM